MDAKPATRRRFRYSLRGLMLLTLGLGGGLGVWGEKARRQRSAVAAIVAYGGLARYDYDMVDGHFRPDRHPSEPKWLLRRFGIDFFHNVKDVILVKDFNPDEYAPSAPDRALHPVFAKLADLPGLRILHLNGTTDAEIDQLRGFTGLEELYIDEAAPGLSDAGLQPLSNLKKLKTFFLMGPFTDVGLSYLSGLRNLEDLELWCGDYSNGSKSKPITDEGLKYLRGMTKLRELTIDSDQIGDEGLAEIAKLGSIEMLFLSGGRFSNRGAAALRGMKKLKNLRLFSGPHSIDDAGLESIAALENLDVFELYDSQITDRGLQVLAKNPRLKFLSLIANSKLTRAGFDRLKAARPDIHVSH